MQIVSIPISKMNEQNLTKESWLIFASSARYTSFPLCVLKETIGLLFPVVDLGIVLEVTFFLLCISTATIISFSKSLHKSGVMIIIFMSR